MSQPADSEPDLKVLAHHPAGSGSRRLALAVALLSAALFFAMLPWARTPLGARHWFIPLVQSALIINDVMTATLLLGQLRMTRVPALLTLAAAYVFAAAMASLHLLSFPGVFAPAGLIGGGQTTPYLYIFWHSGFPLLVLAYALTKERRSNRLLRLGKAVSGALLLVALAVATLGLLAVYGEGLFPRVLAGIEYTPGFNVFRYGQWALTALAAGVLWKRRSNSVLDTWLLVTLCAWFFEIGLAAIFNAGRYDLGFYAGRVYALLASGFVLLVLLIEQGQLYRDLASAAEIAQSESALRETRQVLKLAMEGGQLGAWSRDLVQRTAWWSPELEQMIGLPPGSLARDANALAERIHADDRDVVRRTVEAAVAQGGDFAIEFRLQHADGSWRWMDGRGRVVANEDGRPVNLFGILIDITARREAAQAALEVEARFRTMANSMPQLAWMARADGWIYWYNERWHQYTGTTAQQMEGWGWQRVHDPAVLPTVLVQWRASIDSGEPFEMTFPLLGADGRFRPFLTRVLPLKDAAGRVQHWFGTNTDITAQREAEEVLRRSDKRKDEFLATLAHELRNPLAPIRTGVELLRRASPLPSAAERARDIIDRQSSHLARLVDDLLDVARITQGKVQLRQERVSLAACLKEALGAVQGQIEEADHRTTLDIADEPLVVSADPTRLIQIFVNLLNNAAKFTPPGGHIRVTAGRRDDQAQVRIGDNGIGLAPEHLQQVFEMFAQLTPSLNRDKGGLGIGLSLVRALVELHGGSVSAHSAGAGKGSEFVVEIPLQDPVVETEAGARTDPAPGQHQRVLVVDDNQDAAHSLTALLGMLGHEVREEHDGPSALRTAGEFEPDIVLLDVGMPGMNGLDVARELRKQPAGSRMKLVAITGWGQAADRQLTRDAGFDLHLTKPVELAQIEQLLSGAAKTRLDGLAPGR